MIWYYLNDSWWFLARCGTWVWKLNTSAQTQLNLVNQKHSRVLTICVWMFPQGSFKEKASRNLHLLSLIDWGQRLRCISLESLSRNFTVSDLTRYQAIVENRRQTRWAAQGRNPQSSSFKILLVLLPEMLEGSSVFLPPKWTPCLEAMLNAGK